MVSPMTQADYSSNCAPQLVYRYDVDEAVLREMERGRLHEWAVVKFTAICWGGVAGEWGRVS